MHGEIVGVDTSPVPESQHSHERLLNPGMVAGNPVVELPPNALETLGELRGAASRTAYSGVTPDYGAWRPSPPDHK